jgi:subfamily B ATP-binding cassette protein MsbA
LKASHTIKRTLGYAGKLHHYLPEYVIYTFLGVILGLFNIALLIPILDVLFNTDKISSELIAPQSAFSLTYIKDLFYYKINSLIASGGKMYGLAMICMIIGISALLTNFFRYMAARTLIRFKLNTMQNIRNELFAQYTRSDIAFFQKNKRGDLVNTLTSEVFELEHSLLSAYQVILRDPLVIVFTFIGLFYMSFKLTLFALLFFPIAGFIISRIIKKLKSYGYFSQEYAAQMLSKVDETIGSIKIVKSFTAEDKTTKEFSNINQEFTTNSKKLFKRRELAAPSSEFMGILAVIGLVLFGGYLIFSNSTALNGATFIGYIAFFTQMIQPFKNLSGASSGVQRGLVSAEKLFSYLDEEPEIKAIEPIKALPALQNQISFEEVSFAYDQTKVLNKINLTVQKGQKVALVGESGAGKSTIADLCSRFYDVTEGAIKFDNINIKQMTLKNLRSLVGIVTQEPILFMDTIANNIKYNTQSSDEEMIDAAKTANAHDFIMQLENGYDTMVGDRGNRLSGGQRQRITIARAVLKNPEVLVLDEATSALDTESEKAVQVALEHLMENRTSIIIAHRLSTVMNCDSIIVLKQGEIVEQGTHQALIAQKGYYEKLVNMQGLV